MVNSTDDTEVIQRDCQPMLNSTVSLSDHHLLQPLLNNTVTSSIELQCIDNHTLVDPDYFDFTCLETGEWGANITLAYCRREYIVRVLFRLE